MRTPAPMIHPGVVAALCLLVGVQARSALARPAAEELRQQVEASADSAEDALVALRQLVAYPAPWPEYAARRLRVLAEAGVIPLADTDLVRVHKKIFSDRLGRDDLFAAAVALDRLADMQGRGIEWRLQRLALQLKAQQVDLVRTDFRDLSTRVSPQHSVRAISSHTATIRAALQRHPPAFDAQRSDPVRIHQRQWLETVGDGLDEGDANAVLTLMQEADEEGQRHGATSRAQLERSFWLLMDAALRRCPTEQLVTLQDLGDSMLDVENRVPPTTAAGVMAQWRRHPWSTIAQDDLLHFGRDLLRRGQYALAERTFMDLEAHALTADRRARAGDGRRLSAASLAVRAPVPGMAPPAAETVEHASLRLPRVPTHHAGLLYDRQLMGHWEAMPWPMVTVQFTNDLVVVGSPLLLAAYRRASTDQPVWTQRLAPEWLTRTQVQDAAAPTLTRPAIGHGVVVCPWGSDHTKGDLMHDTIIGESRLPAARYRRLNTDIAAFDLDGGAMRWSTRGRPGWQDLLPAGDPVIAFGHVYAPAISKGSWLYRKNQARAFVVCLDLDNGSVLWKRQVSTVTVVEQTVKNPYCFTGMDLQLGVAERSLYLCGGEAVSKLDARDGFSEWKFAYYGHSPNSQSIEPYINRVAQPPIIAGDLLIVSPSDRPGMFALDRHTGARAWDNPLLPRFQTIGLAGGRLVIRDDRHLAACDPATGELTWWQSLPEPIRGRGHIHGDRVLVAAGDRLFHFALDDGRRLHAQPYSVDIKNTALDGDRLYAVGIDSDSDAASRPADAFVDRQGVWHLPRPVPRLYRAPRDNPLHDLNYLLSEGFCEAFEFSLPPRKLWTRSLAPDFRDMQIVADQALLVHRHDVIGVDGRSGRFNWRIRNPVAIEEWQAHDGRLFIRGDRKLTAVDLSDGATLWQTNIPPSRLLEAVDAYDDVVYVVREGSIKDRGEFLFAMRFNAADGAMIDEVEMIQGRPTMRTDGHRAWFISRDRRLTHFDLRTSTLTTHVEAMTPQADIDAHKEWVWHPFLHDVRGPYLLAEGLLRPNHHPQRIRHPWVVNADKPGTAYAAGGLRRSLLGDHHLLEMRGRRFAIVDLQSGRPQMSGSLPPACELVDASVEGDKVHLASMVRPSKRRVSPVNHPYYRLDVASLKSGRSLGGKYLDSTRDGEWRIQSYGHSWSSQAAASGDIFFVTDRYGMHAARVTEHEDGDDRLEPVYVREASALVDGDPKEFDADALVRPTTRAIDPPPELRVEHDLTNLFLALSYPNEAHQAYVGDGRYGGDGDRLAFSLRTNRRPNGKTRGEAYDWDMGLDPRGVLVTNRHAPRGLVAACRHDINARRTSWEMTIPLDSIRNRDTPFDDDIELTLTLLDGGLRNGPLARWHQAPLRLQPLTRGEEKAALALAALFPELKESQWFLERLVKSHVGRWPAGKRFLVAALSVPDAELYKAMTLRLAHAELLELNAVDPAPQLSQTLKEVGAPDSLQTWYAAHADAVRRGGEVALPAAAQVDSARAAAILRENIPPLRRTGTTARFFSAMVRLLDPQPEKEVELIAWFLKQMPEHPEVLPMLYGIWENLWRLDPTTARERMEAVLRDCRIAADTAYRFRRSRYSRDHYYVRQWHVAAPFPLHQLDTDDLEITLPPAQERITLKEKYRLPSHIVGWRPLYAEDGRVRVREMVDSPYPRALAYAVSWVESPRAGRVVMEVGSLGVFAVWVNGKLAYRGGEDRPGWQPPDTHVTQSPLRVTRIPVWLPRKWSSILVETANGRLAWDFSVEFVAPDGSQPLADLREMQPAGPRSLALIAGPAIGSDPVTGLRAEYFDSVNLTRRKLVRRDPNVDFGWGVESPAPELDWDRFSVRWTGKITPEFSEEYRFATVVNDGVRLWIDNKLVIDHWAYHGALPDYAKIKLTAGHAHDFRMEHYEQTDWAEARLRWSSPSVPEQPVPTSGFASSWYLVDSVTGIRDPTVPTGPPRIASIRVRPREAWVPPGDSVQMSATYLDQYGDPIVPETLLDPYGEPLDHKIKWSAVPGANLNPAVQYGGGYWLEHRHDKGNGTVDANGLFTSDGTMGGVTIVAQLPDIPSASGTGALAVEDFPSINPMTDTPLRIGSDGGRLFSGEIDRVRIYTNALSNARVIQHANGGELTDEGLLADWTFDERVDGRYANSASEGLTAVEDGPMQHITDHDGSYVRFAGGHLVVADDPRLNFSKRATLEVWLRPIGKTCTGVVLDRGRGGTVQGFHIRFQSGLIAKGLFSHGWLETGYQPPTTLWTHIAVVYDVNGIRKVFAEGKVVMERKAGVQVVD